LPRVFACRLARIGQGWSEAWETRERLRAPVCVHSRAGRDLARTVETDLEVWPSSWKNSQARRRQRSPAV